MFHADKYFLKYTTNSPIIKHFPFRRQNMPLGINKSAVVRFCIFNWYKYLNFTF